MIGRETIERAIDIIVAQCDPEQVFVIGSYAAGVAKRSSDLDLIVVQRSPDPKRARERRLELLLAPLMIPVDLNVYTPEEFEDECRDPLGFARMATQLQGKLVYSRALGDFAALHRLWDRESSAGRHARLRDSGAEWQLYQAGYARLARSWPEPPWAYAAAVARDQPGARVADLGCGECELARELARPVISVDHRAARDGVIEADLAHLPLPNGSIDLAVASVSLIGANWRDYLAEAVRILAPGGTVVVTELAGGRVPAEIVEALARHGAADVSIHARGGFVDVRAGRLIE